MRILVTRPEAEAIRTAESIVKLGHEPIICPIIKTVFIKTVEILPSKADLIILTSGNGARGLAYITEERDCEILCVGEATAETAINLGFNKAKYVPEEYGGNAAGMARYIENSDVKNRLLHYCGAEASEELAGLKNYTKQQVYKIIPNVNDHLLNLLLNGGIDYITFFSPQTAEIFMNWAKDKEFPRNISILALSSAVADKLGTGWREVKSAQKPDLDALLSLIT
jgi:uroporphyrinogen-III synthase